MDKKIIMQGWECPKCGAVMSPTTSVCVNCNGHIEVSVNCSGGYIAKELEKLILEGEEENG